MKETDAGEVTPQEALRILSWERCQYGTHHQTEPGTIEELREKREKAQEALDTARSVYLRYRDTYQQAVDEFDRLDVSVYRALEGLLQIATKEEGKE